MSRDQLIETLIEILELFLRRVPVFAAERFHEGRAVDRRPRPALGGDGIGGWTRAP